MATTSDIRNGLCMEYNGDLYTVVQFQHVKPGKGAAFVRTKLKNVNNGKVIENTFSAGHKINVQRIERRPHQFLYSDDIGYHFMNAESFEQVSLEGDLIENPSLLKEGMEVEIVFHAEKEMPLFCDLPSHVTMEVTYTEPGLKGDTSSSTALKPATLENDIIVSVPLFVNQGDFIKIDTRDLSYVERVKK